MNMKTDYFRRLALLAALAGVAALSGCGGEEGAVPTEDTADGPGLGGALLCFAEVLVSGNDQCATSALSSGTGFGAGGGGASYADSSQDAGGATSVLEHPINLQAHDETEPNDALTSANNVYAAYPIAESDRVGWTVDGDVNDGDDVIDAFAFVPRRTRYYRFVLCPASAPDCETRADGRHDPLTVFFRTYDQYGTPMTDTQAGSAAQNDIAMQLRHDEPVYFTVEAGDTMGGTVAYQLRVYEAG
jgi:hypothetical protein